MGTGLNPSGSVLFIARSEVNSTRIDSKSETEVDDTPQKQLADKQVKYVELHKIATEMTAAAQRGQHGDVQRLADSYAALVLGYSHEQVDVSRSFFLLTVFSTLGGIERKCPIRSDAREQLAEDLVLSLEEVDSIKHLVEAFKSALQRLSVIGKAVQGPKIVRIETALRYLRRNFTERLHLAAVARMAGFSVPGFVRIFREMTGTSFLPFVRALRVELAKTLLGTTKMTVEDIAASSGFRSSVHLIRSLRIVTGRRPSEFRTDNRISIMPENPSRDETSSPFHS